MDKKWTRSHPSLDVWTLENVLDNAVLSKIRTFIEQQGSISNDFFAKSYQNIIDPNLSVQYIGPDPAVKPGCIQASQASGALQAAQADPASDSLRVDDQRGNDDNDDADGWTTDDVDGQHVYSPPRAAKNQLNDRHQRSDMYRWIAVNCKIRQDGKTCLGSEIPRYPPVAKPISTSDPNYVLYFVVKKLLDFSVEPLTNLRNWVKYSNTAARRDRTRDHNPFSEPWEYNTELQNDSKAQYPVSKLRTELPFNKFAEKEVPFQVVVKVQRVIVQPGKSYKGLWHDEGLHEKIIAALVYYTNIPADSLTGGEIQFAPKGDMDVEFGHATDIKDAWRKRIKHKVTTRTNSAVFFSNFQTVHRVLEIENKSSMPQVREFICIFIVDPNAKERLPTAVRLHQEYSRTSAFDTLQQYVVVNDLLKIIQQYCPPDEGVHYSIERAKQIRQLLFADQMKPKQNGTWMLYSTGNGDCKAVGWSSVKAADFMSDPGRDSWYACMHGTDNDDWIPTYSDDDDPEKLQARKDLGKLRDQQTRAY